MLSKSAQIWSAAGFYAALAPSRSEQEKEHILEEIYSKYAARVAKDPAQHGVDCVFHVLCIEKVA